MSAPPQGGAAYDVIGVATGSSKAAAIRGALEGKLISALITDQAAAVEVLRQGER